MMNGKVLYNYTDIEIQDRGIIGNHTNKIILDNKSVDKYYLIKFDTYFYDEIVPLVTALELIEKVSSIKDINYIPYNDEKEADVKPYNDEVFKEIISHHKYKYSIIATLDSLLSKLSIENNALRMYKENDINAL